MVANLGRLEQVELRDIWAYEDRDFTPWLALEDNLKLLGDTIGLELELEDQEKSVGPFSADILCKDTADNSWVLVENQLERTDHTHLGQLLTYASGLQAVTIVWVSRRFTEEHRAALDWLNEITNEKFRFFGLEIEVWRIGDSGIAPKFNIVSKPNDWSRDVARRASQQTKGELSTIRLLQLDFWGELESYINEHGALFKSVKPKPQHWLDIGIGRTGFQLCAIASSWDSVRNTGDAHEIRAELYLAGPRAKERFFTLSEQKEKIEKDLGRELRWHNSDKANACRISSRKEIDLHDRSNWNDYIQWLVEELNDFYKYFRPIIRDL